VRRPLLILSTLLALVVPAQAERLVTTVSRDVVSITSSFDGETLTVFGNIEPKAGAALPYVEGPYHIVIVITGPLQNRVARRKENLLGVWLNTQQVVFEAFPSLYYVLSDTSLGNIADPPTLDRLKILPDREARKAARGASWWDSVLFADELVRLMREEGFLNVNPQGVSFRSDTLYSAQVALSSNVAPGPYLVHTYLFKDGVLVADRSEGFSVRKTGFERFLGLAAIQQPLLYGLAAVVLALFTGWLGGVVFRR